MDGITIKIHNVMHEPWDDDTRASEVEAYISHWIIYADVLNVRIAKGHRNSPIFITVDERMVSFEGIERICRNALRGFNAQVSGVDINRTLRDSNIKIVQE